MNREILRLAIPNILANISVPLLSSFDTILMGQLGGGHIAAVGLGAMSLNFVYWNFGFLRMATTGLVAQAFGRNDTVAQRLTFRRALIMAGLIAAALLVLQVPLARLTGWLLNLRPGQAALVGEYFFVRMLAAPAVLGQMVLFGWFFGRQDARTPLLLTLIVNSVNLVVSYYLVVHLGWGIRGVALGTLTAQYVGLLAGLGRWWARRPAGSPGAAGAERLTSPTFSSSLPAAPQEKSTLVVTAPSSPSLSDFLRINGDIFIRTFCLTLSFVFFYNRANALEVTEAVIAANVILLQLVNWLSYGTDGFAFAAESLVGKYAGAGQPARLQRVMVLIFRWGMGLAGVYALIYGLGGRSLLGLFAPPETAVATLDAATQLLPLIVLFCLLATPCYLLDGVLVGLTASRVMRQTMLLAFAGYLLGYYCCGQYYGNPGLWSSLIFFMVLRAATMGRWLWPLIVRGEGSLQRWQARR